ncbi:MAG: DUF3795 domain-containing protein [Candidatus Bathyarchaeota archaeon]|nr:DUF3795 domain-containing protein [Candidatus Bathyarchaeota archaeon]
MKESNKNLVGYCGLYCGACGIYQGKIRQAVENLRKVTKAYGFDKITRELATWEPAFQHYVEYEKVLDGWVKIFGECPGCVADGGDPNCAVRNCCREKSYTTCAECAEIEECEKLKKYGLHALEGIKKIKTMGIDKWVEEMRRKVDAGYCYLDERT